MNSTRARSTTSRFWRSSAVIAGIWNPNGVQSRPPFNGTNDSKRSAGLTRPSLTRSSISVIPPAVRLFPDPRAAKTRTAIPPRARILIQSPIHGKGFFYEA